MDRECGAIVGQASMTIASSASIAALSAAPLDETIVFSGDSNCCSVPSGSTDKKPLPQFELRQGYLETEASCEAPGQFSGQLSLRGILQMPRPATVWWNKQRGVWRTDIGGTRHVPAKGKANKKFAGIDSHALTGS